jgi:hypothetical protein
MIGNVSESRTSVVRRLRWFGAELLIVVFGVLIALAAQGWWQRRENASREHAYLRQLSTDLARTVSRMDSADSAMRMSDDATVNLLRSFRSNPYLPDDSIRSWLVLFAFYQHAAPVTATAEALVSTGDLRLIRDEKLRSAITAYLGESRNLLAEQDRAVNRIIEAATPVLDQMDLIELLAITSSPAAIDSLVVLSHDKTFNAAKEAGRSPFPVNINALLRNRTVYNGLMLTSLAKGNLAYWRNQMRESARLLQERVDSLKLQ